MKSVRFLVWFAFRDLFERHARLTSLVNIATVGFVVACLIVAYGWTVGVQKIGEEKLRRDPLNLCLWCGPGPTKRITREGAAELQAKLQESLGTEARARCFVFGGSDFRWHHKSQGIVVGIEGRTVLPDDPLLQSIPLRVGGRESIGDADKGFVVSRSMLTALGYANTELPRMLRVEIAGGVVDVPVLDIADRSYGDAEQAEGPGQSILPLGHEFIVGEQYETELRNENPNEELQEVSARPIPDDWPDDIAEMPATVQELIRQWSIQIVPKNQGEWNMFYAGKDQLPVLSLWKEYLVQINAAMNVAVNPATGSTFTNEPRLEVDSPAKANVPLKFRGEYDWMGVYVGDLQYLSPADQVARTEGLTSLNQTVIDRLLKLREQTEEVLQILQRIGLIFLAVAIWNMWAIEYLRNKQKVAEIGMLKAIGMQPVSLVSLACCEASILWFFGFLIGVGLGMGLGYGRAYFQYGSELMLLGFYWTWLVIGLGGLVSALVCLVSGVSATFYSHMAPPCESLRAG